MALDMTPEEKQIGKDNFHRAVGQMAQQTRQQPGQMNRRQFMGGLIAAGATVPIAAAAYYGYSNSGFGNKGPVKAGIIGCGDEGGVLVGEHNPEYMEFVAYSDIRPSNQERIFVGEPRGPRRGFNHHYGNNARQRIRLYENYRDMLADKEIEVIVIALPLHLHAPVAIQAMQAGKHVLCEKLMAWNIQQCKDMIAASDTNDKILSIGHQRHYSLLYAHALEMLNAGVLGEIRHIRALWHRHNAKPLTPDDPRWNPDDPGALYKDSWRKEIPEEDSRALSQEDLRRAGFRNMKELVRWRLYNRTGGGLMAELGSHQLDACSIFLGKVKPLAVSSVGGKYFYDDDREVEDHVFCTYEFPGKNYWENEERQIVNDPNDVIVVTYSSINTNGFEPYGECVMGTNGTLILEQEKNAMLYGIGGRSTGVTVNTSRSGQPALDTYASDAPGDRSAVVTGAGAMGQDISRGYREEMEHLAYIIRMREEGMERDRNGNDLKPKCDGRAAMGDAIMALTANQAMKNHTRIKFDPRWFQAGNPAIPDADMIPQGPLPSVD